MKTEKVLRRIERIRDEPELLEQLARDVAVALANGDRNGLGRVGRALAAAAPTRARGEQASDRDYWAGFSAAIGTLLAAHATACEGADARDAVLRALSGEPARAAVTALATAPMTGAELAAYLGVTPGAASKTLSHLRGAGLARTLGGIDYPKRGARKPHVLTALGSWAADYQEKIKNRGDLRSDLSEVPPLALTADAS